MFNAQTVGPSARFNLNLSNHLTIDRHWPHHIPDCHKHSSHPHLGVALLWSCTQQLDPQPGPQGMILGFNDSGTLWCRSRECSSDTKCTLGGFSAMRCFALIKTMFGWNMIRDGKGVWRWTVIYIPTLNGTTMRYREISMRMGLEWDYNVTIMGL